MNEQELNDNISKLLQRVGRSAQKSQFHNSDILALAASKTRSAQEVAAAYRCGLTHFGESYLQEAVEKILSLSELAITWHFIGPIQSNKTRQIAEYFDWVHSIDRPKIATRLSEQRPEHLPPLQVCIQVNISQETSKSGVSLEELTALAQHIEQLPKLTLRGLMAIPAPREGLDAQRAELAPLREALRELQKQLPHLDTLSMGMSSDLEAAICEGATIVRVGTDIFGPRHR
ncbi:MAG: YggS family pyridoxal phosphate-dependent enzyme [Halioglobus sp.]